MSDRVEAIALSPFVELELGTMFDRVELDGIVVATSQLPFAGVVVPAGEGPSDLAEAVDAARVAGRERGKTALAWWIVPEHSDLGVALESHGLVHADTPGFEAIETAMVLRSAPVGDVGEVDVRRVSTFEEFTAANAVIGAAFGLPDVPDDVAKAVYEQFSVPGNPARQYVAYADGQPVGAAFAVAGDAAINLFGGAVLPDARGRGVYRALTKARWDEAVDRGTPALTVQAGRMSRPILEKSGFEALADVRLYVDAL